MMRILLFVASLALLAGPALAKKEAEVKPSKKAAQTADKKDKGRSVANSHEECERYLYCEATYCGKKAYNRCLDGEDPTGRNSGGGGTWQGRDCDFYLRCEATYCGQEAYDRCQDGKDPTGR